MVLLHGSPRVYLLSRLAGGSPRLLALLPVRRSSVRVPLDGSPRVYLLPLVAGGPSRLIGRSPLVDSAAQEVEAPLRPSRATQVRQRARPLVLASWAREVLSRVRCTWQLAQNRATLISSTRTMLALHSRQAQTVPPRPVALALKSCHRMLLSVCSL